MPRPHSPPAAADATHWLAVACATGAGLAIALNVGKVPLALPVLRQELNLSLVQAGWVASALTTVSVVLASLAGMWVGHLGALRMVLGGLLLGATASVAGALWANGYASMLALRVLEGLSFMSVVVAGPALISAASAAGQRRMALGLWSTYMPAGASLAMAAAPSVLPVVGWRGLWVCVALGLLLAAVALYSQRHHYAAHEQPVRGAGTAGGPPVSFWAPVGAALGQPLPWLLAMSFGVWALQHFALIIWMPTYLIEQRGASGATAALLTALMLVACVPGNVLGGMLVQRGVPRGWLLALAQLTTGAMAVVYSQEAWPDALRFAAAVLLSFTGGLIPAAVMSSSTVLARTPQQIGTLQGLYMQGSQIGQLVGTPLIAAVVARTGLWSQALWVTGCAALLGVAAGLLVWRLEPLARKENH